MVESTGSLAMPADVLLPEPPTAAPTPSIPQPRPRKHLVLLGLLLFICLWIVSWFGLLGELEVSIGAQPISVQLQGLTHPGQIVLTYLTTVGDSDGDEKQFGFVIPHEELMFPSRGRDTWRIAGHWIKTIHITAPESVVSGLTSAEVRIGDSAQTYRNLASWKRLPQPIQDLLPNRNEAAITIELPAPPDSSLPAINSVPLGTFVQQLFQFPLLAITVAFAAGWILVSFARSPTGIDCWRTLNGSPAFSTDRAPKAWFFAGLALAVFGIAMLYSRYSFPFTQDDNFSQFLPMVLYNCRTLLAGHWPAWNPHQFLGAPVATMGIYSVTYPPLYLAYGLARALGSEYWTIEIYTLLHLTAGYALLYGLLRRMGTRASLAATAGASFVLSGWFLIAGRSQMTFAPLAVWPVAMAWSVHYIATVKRATWTWTLLSALSIGLFFHAGHSQMWVYGMMFYAAGLGLYWLAGRLHGREALQAIPAIVIGIGIAAPLLVLQAIEGTSSARNGAYGDRIEFLHMLLPLGNLLPRPVGLGSAGFEYFCEMYYSGTLFQALSFLALLMAVAHFALAKGTSQDMRNWLGENVWVVLFATAILFGLGSKGILWTAFAQLPIFDRFRWPIKFAYFCLLYSTLGGALIAERWFTRRPKLQYPMLAAVACLLLVHVQLSRTSWYDFSDRPYPATPAILQPTVDKPEGRLLTRWGSMDRSPQPGFYNTLPLDFATHAGAYAIGGYDTFLEGSLAARRVRYKFWADPVAAARAYGVKWISADRTLDHPVASANPFFSSLDAPSIGNIRAIHAAQDAGRLLGATTDGLTVHQLSGSDPLAFLEGDPRKTLPVQMNSEGVFIDTSSAKAGDAIICNIAMRPWMRSSFLHGDGPLESDDWGRIRLRLPQQPPSAQIAILYRPPWTSTLALGALLILAGLGGSVLTGKLSRNQQQTRAD